VLDTFERIGRKMGVLPETRPTRYVPVQLARPGTGVRSNQASPGWAATAAGALTERGFSLEQIARLSSREVAAKLFDAVETLTYRAANLQPNDLKRLSTAPLRLWEKRAELPGLLLEKGARVLIRNGKQLD
jgi:8-amino-7-oxononanoate synthase